MGKASITLPHAVAARVLAVATALLLLVGGPAPAAAAPKPSGQAGASPAPEWNGEYFSAKQGGAFLKVSVAAFRPLKQAPITSDAQVTVVNLLSKAAYVLTQPVDEGDGVPRVVWKLPSGKYAITSVELVDGVGKKRKYASSDGKTFAIKRLCLSNLGILALTPEGPSGLGVNFTIKTNPYKETGDRKLSSVVAVINGYNGLIQERFAGKELLRKSEGGYQGAGELRQAVTFTRQIAMFFRLDLLRHNHLAKPVAEVLTVSDPNLRNCYQKRLDDNPKLAGDVQFSFILSKDTGTMLKIKHRGGSLDDPKLVECLYYELSRLQFPVPETMLGELTYSFSVR